VPQLPHEALSDQLSDIAVAGLNLGSEAHIRDTSALTMKWKDHPNLRHRPHAPAAGRGRLQVAVRRAILAADASEISSSQVYDWAFRSRRQRRSQGNRRRVWQLLAAMATPIGRDNTIGRPWAWRLREPLK
jgi:hypothetical protein